MGSLRSYVEVTKPRIVLLLVFTSVTAMVVASRSEEANMTPALWVLATIAITLSCAGCNATTCYIDRDIDAVMERTKGRPLPSGRIVPPERALYWGLAILAASLLLASMRNLLAFAAIAIGALDNVVVYSWLLKRRTSLNIVLGGVSGGLPVIFGWAYVTGGISVVALLMAALVVLWVPNHIWSLAERFKEDYAKAKVPMLPVVTEGRRAVQFIVYTSFVIVLFSLLLYLLGAFGVDYLAVAILLGIVMLSLNTWLLLRPTQRNAWVVFKFSSPYLAIIFLSMLLMR